MIEMSGEFIAFFVLAVCAIGGAVFMLNFTRVVHMVLSLAFTLLSIAGIYVLLNAEFLAVAQVLIYTGSVSILMLFGIMLTRHRDQEETVRPWHSFFSFVGVGALFGILIHTIYNTPLKRVQPLSRSLRSPVWERSSSNSMSFLLKRSRSCCWLHWSGL